MLTLERWYKLSLAQIDGNTDVASVSSNEQRKRPDLEQKGEAKPTPFQLAALLFPFNHDSLSELSFTLVCFLQLALSPSHTPSLDRLTTLFKSLSFSYFSPSSPKNNKTFATMRFFFAAAAFAGLLATLAPSVAASTSPAPFSHLRARAHAQLLSPRDDFDGEDDEDLTAADDEVPPEGLDASEYGCKFLLFFRTPVHS